MASSKVLTVTDAAPVLLLEGGKGTIRFQSQATGGPLIVGPSTIASASPPQEYFVAAPGAPNSEVLKVALAAGEQLYGIATPGDTLSVWILKTNG